MHRMYVEDGLKFALARTGSSALEGHEPELAKLAGQKVSVKGTLKSGKLSVREVVASK